MDKGILSLENISFSYSKYDKKVIDGLNLSIDKGEKIALLGRNGIGKSTLFSLATGLERPDEGKIYLNNKEIKYNKKDLRKLRKSVGLVFQDPETQFIAPTVEEEISFGPLNLGYSQEETRDIVDRVLGLMEIEDFRTRSTYSLSGGEKKLITIGSVMALDPEIILFDEPTAGLDNYNTARLLEWLKILEDQGLGLVISTHDIDFAYQWADRILILAGGRIGADGPTVKVMGEKDLMEENKLDSPHLFEFARILGLDKEGLYPKTLKELEEMTGQADLDGGNK